MTMGTLNLLRGMVTTLQQECHAFCCMAAPNCTTKIHFIASFCLFEPIQLFQMVSFKLTPALENDCLDFASNSFSPQATFTTSQNISPQRNAFVNACHHKTTNACKKINHGELAVVLSSSKFCDNFCKRDRLPLLD